MYRKFSISFLCLFLALLLGCGALVYVIDPMFHYHAPWTPLPPVTTDERHQVGGIAENFDYDSILIGTSVTANFRASWFDEAFSCKTAKFTFPGGNFGEFIKALNMAYEDHEIQRVFWGLDTNLLTAFPQESTELLPDYLYNDNPWDDVEYLYNKDVLFRQIVSMLYAFRWDPVPTVDDLFAWENRYEWGPQAVMKVYGRLEPTPMMGSDIFSAETSANLQIILPYVQAHPETEFYFFIPPYSIVFWDRVYRRGTLEGTLAAQEAALQALAQCDNVHVYYPCAEEEVICDLEQYTDPIHYSPQVNQWITEEMASSSGLTPQEIPQAVEEMRQLAWNYPYEELFALYPPQLPPET